MEVPSEKSATMAFLGQDQVRSKIIVDNKCLQQENNLNILVLKFPMKMKIFNTK
jgi:hypothetical protein